MGRAQALDPSTFLIDQDKNVLAIEGGFEIGNQRPDLRRAFHVAREKDKATRALRGEQGALVGCQSGARAAGYKGFECHSPGLASGGAPVKRSDQTLFGQTFLAQNYWAITRQSPCPWAFS